jgi:hypothetical protein
VILILYSICMVERNGCQMPKQRREWGDFTLQPQTGFVTLLSTYEYLLVRTEEHVRCRHKSISTPQNYICAL